MTWRGPVGVMCLQVCMQHHFDKVAYGTCGREVTGSHEVLARGFRPIEDLFGAKINDGSTRSTLVLALNKFCRLEWIDLRHHEV